jgi:hypothetical protein
MSNDSVIFKIYIRNENNEINSDKEYIFNLNDKIIDIKNRILKESFNNKFNALDMENITEKVYKDFGKLFFDKGLLPVTVDKYKLGEFTIGNRTFSFLVMPKNVEMKADIKSNDNKELSFLKKMIKEDMKKTNNNQFIYDIDFPPLK